MRISYNWYTTNYRHAAVFATLIVKATVYNKPFTFNSFKKISFKALCFINFRDNFIFSGTPGQSVKIRDCPGQSGTYGMYDYMDMKKFFKNFFLRNLLSDFEIISQECSLGDPFQKVFAKF